MNFITVTELRLKATQVVSEIEKTGKEIIVTKKGKPVVLMRLIEENEFKLKTKGESEVKKNGKRKKRESQD